MCRVPIHRCQNSGWKTAYACVFPRKPGRVGREPNEVRKSPETAEKQKEKTDIGHSVPLKAPPNNVPVSFLMLSQVHKISSDNECADRANRREYRQAS